MNLKDFSVPLANTDFYNAALRQLSKQFSFQTKEKMNVGKSNTTWLVEMDGDEYFVNLGTGIREQYIVHSDIYQGYMNINKYAKAKQVCDHVRHQGVVVPRFVQAGHGKLEDYLFPYALQTKITGRTLYEEWPELNLGQRKKVLGDSLDYLEKIAGLGGVSRLWSDSQKWYRARFYEMLNLAVTHSLTPSLDQDRLAQAFESILAQAAPKNAFGVLHGDYFQKNILMREGVISGVIDWEASMIEGHLGWDYVLSLWWFTGEAQHDRDLFEYSFDPARFKSMFSGSFDHALLLIELVWYLTAVTEFSIMNRYERYDRRVRRIQDIVDCVEQERNYSGYNS